MNRPEAVPPAVVAGLERYSQRHEGVSLAWLLEVLGWDALCGCYYFTRDRVFHGVELDGHIHT